MLLGDDVERCPMLNWRTCGKTNCFARLFGTAHKQRIVRVLRGKDMSSDSWRRNQRCARFARRGHRHLRWIRLWTSPRSRRIFICWRRISWCSMGCDRGAEGLRTLSSTFGWEPVRTLATCSDVLGASAFSHSSDGSIQILKQHALTTSRGDDSHGRVDEEVSAVAAPGTSERSAVHSCVGPSARCSTTRRSFVMLYSFSAGSSRVSLFQDGLVCRVADDADAHHPHHPHNKIPFCKAAQACP